MLKKPWMKNSFVYLLITVGAIVVFYTLSPGFDNTTEISITEVITKAQNQEIGEIIVQGEKLTIVPRITETRLGLKFTSRMSEQTDKFSL